MKVIGPRIDDRAKVDRASSISSSAADTLREVVGGCPHIVELVGTRTKNRLAMIAVLLMWTWMSPPVSGELATQPVCVSMANMSTPALGSPPLVQRVPNGKTRTTCEWKEDRELDLIGERAAAVVVVKIHLWPAE